MGLVLGWLATAPGFVAILCAGFVFSDAEWLFGCRAGSYFSLVCEPGLRGDAGQLLFYVGLVSLIGLPWTLIPAAYSLGFPVARMILRRRRRSMRPTGS